MFILAWEQVNLAIWPESRSIMAIEKIPRTAFRDSALFSTYELIGADCFSQAVRFKLSGLNISLANALL